MIEIQLYIVGIATDNLLKCDVPPLDGTGVTDDGLVDVGGVGRAALTVGRGQVSGITGDLGVTHSNLSKEHCIHTCTLRA